jgi:hypothetical protein
MKPQMNFVPHGLMAAVLLSTALHVQAQSPVPVATAPATAGASAIGPAARWINASAVNLRSHPDMTGMVMQRLAAGTPLLLLRDQQHAGFCEVELPQGPTGFVACKFLGDAAPTPNTTGSTSPQVALMRTFWQQPSWGGLEGFARQLEEARNPMDGSTGQRAINDLQTPPVLNAELERMKAYLAKGVYGAAPPPMQSWDELKKEALADKSSLPTSDEGVVVGSFSTALVRALELPTIRPSLFKSEADIAPLGESIEGVGGRFGIVTTYRTHGRRADDYWQGLWDIGRVSMTLTQPIVRTTLFRDGHVRQQPTRLAQDLVLRLDEDEKGCPGYVDGFTFGDADAAMTKKQGLPPRDGVGKGSLVSLVTRDGLPAAPSKPVVTRHALDRQLTGFVKGTWMHFDLNGDGVVDLAVWEGVGKGPGHMDGPTTTDDAHLRLFMVNIAGQWKVLGSDAFGYGCGC